MKGQTRPMARTAWNAGLQTGTRSAPRCARPNPPGQDDSRLGAELKGGGDTHGLERRLQPAPPSGAKRKGLILRVPHRAATGGTDVRQYLRAAPEHPRDANRHAVTDHGS